jgi:hypothetical protein
MRWLWIGMAGVVLAVGAIVGGYLLAKNKYDVGYSSAAKSTPSLSSSHTTTTVGNTGNTGTSTSGLWSGTYFWESSDQSDAVLLTLLQGPAGITGSWNETALSATSALALNGDETAKPPNNEFTVQVTSGGSNSLGMTVESHNDQFFDVYMTSGGVQLQYTEQGGGNGSVDLERIDGTQQYYAAAQQIANEYSSSSGDSGNSP